MQFDINKDGWFEAREMMQQSARELEAIGRAQCVGQGNPLSMLRSVASGTNVPAHREEHSTPEEPSTAETPERRAQRLQDEGGAW